MAFKIFGPGLIIKEAEGITTITWKRMSSWEIVLAAVLLMTLAIGIASILGWETLGDMKIFQMSPEIHVVYWGIWLLMAVHLIFNRKSELRLSQDTIFFKKRPFLSGTQSIPRMRFSGLSQVRTKDYHENDTGYYPDIYKLYLLIGHDRRIRIDSFNEEDCKLIREILENR